jgi:DNA-binding NtrC family response regulator
MNMPNVLVVDDDVAVCRILSRMLIEEQYQVQIGQSVSDAVGAIEQKLFDVYVLDYKLTDGTGLDVAERIRSKGSGSPIILISGYNPNAVESRAAELRIFDFIEKPFSRERICNTIKKAIEVTLTVDRCDAESANSSAADPAAAKKGFPKAATIGAIILLLLVFCLTIYLFTHGQ